MPKWRSPDDAVLTVLPLPSMPRMPVPATTEGGLIDVGLPWVRLDTSMPDNPKILDLCLEKDGHRAAFVWICCLAYAGKHGTAGFIPRSALGHLNARTSDMARLVRGDLLTERAGGWLVNGWAEFQMEDEAAQKRREKAMKAAAIRWSKDAKPSLREAK